MTTNVLVAAFLISFLRIAAQYYYYHAPLGITFDFEHKELPRLLNATNLLPHLPEQRNRKYDYDRTFDLAPLAQFNLRLCVGKEWYRFPGHFLIPNGIETRFIKSEFDGLLPQPFHTGSGGALWPWNGMRVVPEGLNDLNKENNIYYVCITSIFLHDFLTVDRLSLSRWTQRAAIISSILISLPILVNQR
jgi:alpha-1,2-mannosyltransferase